MSVQLGVVQMIAQTAQRGVQVVEAGGPKGDKGDAGQNGAPGAGFVYRNEWDNTTDYVPGDVVHVSGYGSFLCNIASTGGFGPQFDVTKWAFFVADGTPGTNGGTPYTNGAWSGATEHFQLEIDLYNGSSYLCNFDGLTSTVPPDQDTANWQLVAQGIYVAGTWNGATRYSIGAIVRSGSASYLATASSLNQTPPNATYWQLLSAT